MVDLESVFGRFGLNITQPLDGNQIIIRKVSYVIRQIFRIQHTERIDKRYGMKSILYLRYQPVYEGKTNSLKKFNWSVVDINSISATLS